MPRRRSSKSRSGPTSFSRAHPRLDLIFNVVSGTRSATSDLTKISESLTPRFDTLRVWKTTPTRDAFVLAQDALADGATLLVAAGGDGTVAAVAAAIKLAVRHAAPVSASASGQASTPQPQLQLQLQSQQQSQQQLTLVQHAQSLLDDGVVRPLLAVIPRGTANALCAALHVPPRVAAAADLIAAGPVRRIDFPTIAHPSWPPPPATPPSPVPSSTSPVAPTASPAGREEAPAKPPAPRSMLLLCGVGLEAETVHRADRQLKRALGVLAYAVAGWLCIWRQATFSADIILHDIRDTLMFSRGVAESKSLRLRGMRLQGVTIANAAPPASVLAQGIGAVRPDDGLLEVVCIYADGPLNMIRTMFSMLFGALMRTREHRGNVFGLRARKVEIVCDPPQKVVIDGEDAGLTPVVLELRDELDSIYVIAPKAGTVNRRSRRLSRSLRRLWRNLRGFAVLAMTVAVLRKKRRRLV